MFKPQPKEEKKEEQIMIKIAIIGLGTLGVVTAHLFRDFHKTLFDTVKWQPHDNILTTIINRVGGLRVDKLPESFYHVSVKEAEYIKLYSNAYLSLRLTFFGELDKQCSLEKLNSARVIKAICHDPRIGDKYNSPPFKIAGKCLPKDLINLAIQTNNPLLQTVVHLMDK